MIPAYLFKPKNKKGPVPVVINIHGGPEGQYLPSFSSFTQFLVNELGVAVLAPNVRGSTGYGKTYLSLDNWKNREKSVEDIAEYVLTTLQKPALLKTYVPDRLQHDKRYALNPAKLKRDTSWEPRVDFEIGIRETILWYRDNADWWRRCKSGAYQEYYKTYYSKQIGELERLGTSEKAQHGSDAAGFVPSSRFDF